MSDADHEKDGLAGERGALRATPSRFGIDARKLLGGAAFIAVGAAALVYSSLGNEKAGEPAKPDNVIRSNVPYEPAPVQLPKVEPVPAPVRERAAAVVAPVPQQEPDPLLGSATRAPVIAFSAGTARGGQGAPSAPGDDAYVAVQQQRSDDEARFQGLLKPTVLQGSKAGTLGNRNFIVAMGASIPCVLETALSSDQPGFSSCVIPRDVLSDNGRVVLMPKGTQVVGEYRGGLRRGQSRLFVLWTRAKTPDGVIISLASPATDGLGRAGFDGYVDTHFWERFGGAILMSMMSDISSWIGDEISKGSEVSATQTTSSGEDAAAIAVEQSINIPPTLIKHQGEVVSIFVARDLDFSNVYTLKVTEPLGKIYDRGVLGDFGIADPLITK
ncbi:type IV secretion system protein VirB10 [Ancylobacter sp. FA202]|uniref:type IV secretion system protein VirB10 n=1 Tax=Ancylobacter sp. FA202 TaxID=1111106 RepID=UPI00036412A7|nr:type IV secretion system protein VirB10 [Ancylobacter sp. FA202]